MRTTDPDSPARTRLLDAAEGLMLSRGYVAATVDGICGAAGLTKGSFFHYFKNKEELGLVLLQRFAERQRAGFAEACAPISDPLERVYCLIECAIQGSQDPEMKGCLVGTFAQEISETHPELREACRCSFEAFAAGMGRDLQAAKELHRPDGDFDAGSLGAYFLSIVQGSMLLMRTNGDRDAMEQNLRHFQGHLKALYGR
jgi:TetR/AcrR family transcriptional regulator, transcriptional repressor for nem operon